MVTEGGIKRRYDITPTTKVDINKRQARRNNVQKEVKSPQLII